MAVCVFNNSLLRPHVRLSWRTCGNTDPRATPRFGGCGTGCGWAFQTSPQVLLVWDHLRRESHGVDDPAQLRLCWQPVSGPRGLPG